MTRKRTKRSKTRTALMALSVLILIVGTMAAIGYGLYVRPLLAHFQEVDRKSAKIIHDMDHEALREACLALLNDERYVHTRIISSVDSTFNDSKLPIPDIIKSTGASHICFEDTFVDLVIASGFDHVGVYACTENTKLYLTENDNDDPEEETKYKKLIDGLWFYSNIPGPFPEKTN